jgi:RNA polymerase-associated protein RTF1
MSDIDDELLALAGDASSGEEEEDTPMNHSKESSGSPRTSGKSGAKKSGARKTGRRQNDSEEEGEA